MPKLSLLALVASTAQLVSGTSFLENRQAPLNPLSVEYAWTTTAILDIKGAITVPISGGNKTIYNVIAGSSFSGPKLNGTFTGVAEVSQTTTEVGDFYQSIDVTVWGHTAQGVPFYAVEGGRGNPTKNQLRRIQIDIGPGHAELLEGLYVGDLLAPPSDRLSIITYEIKDPKITFP